MRSDDLLTSILSCNFSLAISRMSVLKVHHINRRVCVYACKLKEVRESTFRGLVLIIRDTVTNRWVGLRMPTFQKVIKFYRGLLCLVHTPDTSDLEK